MTGITGLLGTNLAEKLIEENYSITALVRDPKRYHGKTHRNLKLVEMDLFEDYDSHLKTSDIVIHIAAVSRPDLLHFKDYEKINYDATIHLFDKAIEHKISTFIYISTANTIGFGNRLHPGTEEKKIRFPFTKSFYALSKLKAEQYLLQKKSSVQLKILNPTFMIGPKDSKPSSGRIILRALNKKIVFYPPGGKNFVPVGDVVHAIIQSFSNGKSRERYLIAGENLTYGQFYKKLKKITGDTQLLIPVPKFIVYFLGGIGSFLKFLHIQTELSLNNMKILSIKNYYSARKSEKDLGVNYSSLENSIRKAVDYFEMHF